MRRAVAVVLGLLGGALAVVTTGAYIFSTFCWEYCEPEDAPTFWDGFKFALPFGVAALGLMAAAVTVWRSGRGSWLGAFAIALGLCVAVPLLFWGVIALFTA
jgi:hypothetical protein